MLFAPSDQIDSLITRLLSRELPIEAARRPPKAINSADLTGHCSEGRQAIDEYMAAIRDQLEEVKPHLRRGIEEA